MKKIVVVIIMAVYIASIAIVNFFGLEIGIFDGIDYVESIQVSTVTLHNEESIDLVPEAYPGGVPLFIFDFIPAPEGKEYTSEDESILTNPNRLQINYEVLPHLADDAEVRFEFDEAAMAGFVVYHETSRTFIFLKPSKIFTITVKAMDGSNESTQVSIMGMLPQK